jgi:hypothetical protein
MTERWVLSLPASQKFGQEILVPWSIPEKYGSYRIDMDRLPLIPLSQESSQDAVALDQDKVHSILIQNLTPARLGQSYFHIFPDKFIVVEV